MASPLDPDEPVRLLERETLLFAQELIRIPSVNTGERGSIGDGEARAARYVQERLEDAGYTTEYAEPSPGRGNLVARLEGSEPERGGLVAHAHLDVVPAEASDWTHPPFAAEIDDGYLYGRGALDLKSYAAVLLAVARHLAREGIVPRRDIVFAFFADEESTSIDGARWAVEERPGWFAGATEALGEVGGFSFPLGDSRAYLVATAEKGAAVARLTAHGAAGHGSRPTSDNPVSRIARAVDRVASHPFEVAVTPALRAFAERTSEILGRAVAPEDLERNRHLLGIAGPLVGPGLRSTVSPTILDAGYKANVIPGRASAQLDVRALPGEADDVRELVASLVGAGVEVDWPLWSAPIEAPAEGPLLDVLQKATAAEDPDAVVVPYLLPAGTDNKHLARLGIHGYGYIPLRTEKEGFDAFGLYHAVDERIPLDALSFATRVTARIIASA